MGTSRNLEALLVGGRGMGAGRRSGLVLTVSLILVGLIALADVWTGYEVRLSILYLIPIAIATWAQGRVAGYLASTIAATTWLLSFHSTHGYSHPIYFYWEGAAAVVSYVVFVVLLSRLRDALARSDERFVTVLEGLEAAVLVEDAAGGQALYANRRFRESFGDSGPNLPESSSLPDGSGEIRDDSKDRWYYVQSRSLRWIDAREVVLREFTDITERKRALELVNRHREEVNRASRLTALGEFASALAHELSQPLAAIATYSNTSLRLLDSGRSDPLELREAMDKCRVQAQRAGAIVKRLREFLRHRRPTLADQDIGDIARRACDLASGEAAEAGATLELQVAPGLPRISADGVLVEQVVLNLVRNAIEAVQHVPQDRRRVRIEAFDSETCAGVVLRVIDDGVGVPEEIIERLFEAFVTTRPDGLGLGLSICRSVIEAHGGTIRHESNGDRGAVFSFTIPGARR